MNVIFKKLYDIIDPNEFPMIVKEMEHLFDGVTVREVKKDNHYNDCYIMYDDSNEWSVIDSWFLKEEDTLLWNLFEEPL